MKRLMVDIGDRSYPIVIGDGLLQRAAEFFEERKIDKRSPLLIVTDDKVSQHYLHFLTQALEQGGYQVVNHIVPSGETSKSLSLLEAIVTTALKAGLDRKSTIVALGGGVVGDLAGFVAASYMRGIRFVQVPTTILAHDSSVGGKVAVNHPLAKNIIGAFHQPALVLYDTETLKTLPERELRAGYAEVIKHGLIWDGDFARWCEEEAKQLMALSPASVQYALYRGCSIKAHIVSQDEKENGIRAILNLGHTIGHALEAVANYNELLHGEAISIGMIGSARLAVKLGYPEQIYIDTKKILKKFGLPVRLPEHMDHSSIIEAMMHDKKFKHGETVFVIPTDIGKVEIRSGISIDLVKQILQELEQEE